MSSEDIRLIEVAFPLEQVSLDLVYEKNMRHGHISTLHNWPTRRPMVAYHTVLMATLLSDLGNSVECKEINGRLAYKIIEPIKEEWQDGRNRKRLKRVIEEGILV